MIGKMSANTGLSPCLRGIRLQRPHIHIIVRFIPVLTGNTFICLIAYKSNAVYPRAYGEYDSSRDDNLDHIGLSPCLRGILPQLSAITS